MSDRTITLRAEVVERLEALAEAQHRSVDEVLLGWLEGVPTPTSQDEALLAEMAADPDIQREIRQIQAEFDGTEADGLTD